VGHADGMTSFYQALVLDLTILTLMGVMLLGLFKRPRLSWTTFIGFASFGVVGAIVFTVACSVALTVVALRYSGGALKPGTLQFIRYSNLIIAVLAGWFGAVRVDRKRRQWLAILYRWRSL